MHSGRLIIGAAAAAFLCSIASGHAAGMKLGARSQDVRVQRAADSAFSQRQLDDPKAQTPEVQPRIPNPPPAPAKKKTRSSASLRGRWESGLSVRGYYDGNILDYSQRDLDHFKSRTHLNKFALETTDDWVSDLGGDVGRRWGSRSRNEYRVRLSADVHWYARNQIKNWVDYAAEGRWARRKTTLIAHLGWTPHFYVRELQARNIPRQYPASPPYRAAEYHAWSANLEYRFQSALPLEHRLSAGWKRTDYSHVFDERDNSTYWAEYGWQVPLTAASSASWSYRYASVLTAGRNLPANFVDISRSEHTLQAGLEYDSPHSPLGAALAVAYERQNFTSGKSTDFDHYGRHDDEVRIVPEIRLTLSGGWRYKLFYQWTHDTSNSKQTADFGAFSDNQLGLRVTHTF
ncbi:MAG: hypothetical protein HZB43_12590 [candidate division Zixibacteria bacterium]|nr:hypothetical protein [candidate division Zixibacteria bacterium]